jgi:hypothetical protein
MVRAGLGLRARAPEVGYSMDKITSQITAQSPSVGTSATISAVPRVSRGVISRGERRGSCALR